MRGGLGHLLDFCDCTRRLPSAPIQVHGQIAFCLPLRAFIAQPHRPALPSTVVLKLTTLHRSMLALVDVIENDFVSVVVHNHEAQAISASDRRQAGTTGRVAEVAEIAQLVICWVGFFGSSATRPAEARAQRQTRREGPGDGYRLFSGIKKWTSHSMSILCSEAVDCVEFFSGSPAHATLM